LIQRNSAFAKFNMRKGNALLQERSGIPQYVSMIGVSGLLNYAAVNKEFNRRSELRVVWNNAAAIMVAYETGYGVDLVSQVHSFVSTDAPQDFNEVFGLTGHLTCFDFR